ncbi:methyltransferase domain-containing protein [Pedobacter changchengzhani]|uniref:Methyltransferase domain-containing protein n=1 Tax=Pedobacter changchengzhani TaxID=2529274 RepID=A0A4R5MI70_9SPHI|nr:methyltransferase domain-containing protein [Pedobacter changchengzhani]TDG35248.1 methyltransferase domain-containing protein [Pedobacter changchengzhani]
MPNTKERSDEPELMDDFALEGETLREALDKIASINTFLGGNKVTLNGVKSLINGCDAEQNITIADIGCGNGDMLRALADYATKNSLNFTLIGVDANAYTIKHAESLSLNYKNISYQCVDIFGDEFKAEVIDIFVCTLTLHHFKDDEILNLVKYFHDKAKIGVVINDLHRSNLAYYLFEVICFVFRLNSMSRQDGLVSILRGFKKADLVRYSKKLNFKSFSIHWKWAFRYQWIIKST